jgi:cation diffusion facilitator family transporter
MAQHDASVKSILFALLANFGIAVTKTVAAVLTGSGAMLAEAIHSYADCGNQGLLFLGLRKTKKQPDKEHPLGYGMEIYFWSFIVALVLFSMGGLFSVYEGIHKISGHEGLRNPMIAIIVLSISIILETLSLIGCMSQINKLRHGDSLWKWSRNTRRSELVVVLGEDIAALVGLALALVAVLLSHLTGNPVWDALGSIAIGTLLIIISVFLAIKVKSLLIGQSTDSETRDSILKFLSSRDEIDEILNVITLQLGPKVMVAVKARMKSVSTTGQLLHNINTCEKELKAAFPEIQWVFFEPDLKKD